MPRQKGAPKTGGRQKGTPNKKTAFGAEYIESLLNDYKESGLMAKDFMEVEPKDRLIIMKDLVNYLVPKKQSVAADITQHVDISQEQQLATLAGLDINFDN